MSDCSRYISGKATIPRSLDPQDARAKPESACDKASSLNPAARDHEIGASKKSSNCEPTYFLWYTVKVT